MKQGYIDLTGRLPSLKSSLTPSAPGYHPAPTLFIIPRTAPRGRAFLRLFWAWLIVTALGVLLIALS